MEGEAAGRVELFEVFKVGGLQRSELEKLSLEDLRKRYILMQNLTSKEQLVTATELAQLPAPGERLLRILPLHAAVILSSVNCCS